MLNPLQAGTEAKAQFILIHCMKCCNCLCPSKAAGTCPQVVLVKGRSCDWDTGLSSTGPRLKTNTWWGGQGAIPNIIMVMMAQELCGIIQTVRKKYAKVIKRCSGILHFFRTQRKRIVQYRMDGAKFGLQVIAFHYP